MSKAVGKLSTSAATQSDKVQGGKPRFLPIGRQRAESGSTVVAEKALAAFPAGEAFP